MATYTDNYSLTKPTFAEVADIRTINGNMDTIDDIMHASQVSLADAYDQTATYNTGDVVMYEFLMYKCKEDNVTGNWDATKWERTTAAETGGGEVDFDLFGEASGNPASFADGSESALVECKTEIVPVQDLHGYDKPWAGGAGKNKLPLVLSDIKSLNTTGVWNGNIYTLNGITFNVETDEADNILSIGLSGIASSRTDFYIAVFNAYGGNYTISGAPANGQSKWNLRIDLAGGGANQCLDDGRGYQSSCTMNTALGTAVECIFRIYQNSNVSGLTLYPMLEAGTSFTTYEPYSNISPISGHSSVTINVSPTSDPSQGVDTTIQLGDTYYSGTLNVVKGELTIDRVSVDMGSLEWSYNSTYQRFGAVISDMKPAEANGTPLEGLICSAYATGSANNTSNSSYNGYIGVSTTRTLYARNENYTDATAFTSVVSGQTVVYPLATPITVQLTPTDINTLLGQNYVSSEDTEDIDLVYVKASAFIKPNPSGEPDGYLSSIELSGEKFEIIKELPTFPTSDGDYKLKLSVSSGVPTLSWGADT